MLPAYNEEQNIVKLLSRIDNANKKFNWNSKVVVVNDGSTDNTLTVLKNFKGSFDLKIVDLQSNIGLAGAMRAGLTFICENSRPEDIIVALDADDSQNPFLIQRMLEQIMAGSELVIASRYQPGARVVGLSLAREIFSYSAGLLFRLCVGLKEVKDYTCGFRAYKAELLQKTIRAYGDNFITQKGLGVWLKYC